MVLTWSSEKKRAAAYSPLEDPECLDVLEGTACDRVGRSKKFHLESRLILSLLVNVTLLLLMAALYARQRPQVRPHRLLQSPVPECQYP